MAPVRRPQAIRRKKRKPSPLKGVRTKVSAAVGTRRNIALILSPAERKYVLKSGYIERKIGPRKIYVWSKQFKHWN